MVNGHTFPEQIQEAVVSADANIQSAGAAYPRAALRPAATSSSGWRRAPPPPISKSKKAKAAAGLRASLSASTGDQHWPRAVRRPHRPPIKSPITQREMPERTHATATPRPAVSIASRRTVPIARAPAPPDRNRWPMGGPARARARNAERMVNGHTFSRANSRSGRSAVKHSERGPYPRAISEGRPPASCRERQRLAESSATADLKVQKSKSGGGPPGLIVGQHRRPALAARRSAPAPPTDQEPDHPA